VRPIVLRVALLAMPLLLARAQQDPRANGWRGAAYGAIGGAVLGGVLGAIECTVSSGSGSESCKVGAAPGAVYGSLIGAAVFVLPGAGIGSLIRSEKWEKVPLDDLQVTVVPMVDTRHAGLALRLRF
jgi:hypothetical protein